jgi:hypothetical protein
VQRSRPLASVERAMSLVSAKHKALNAKFIEAAFDGNHRDVERMLGEGAMIEARERNGYSALSEASIAGQTIVVGILLRALADPNSRANDGRTPLHRAAFHGWQPVVSLLLDNGADPTIRDQNGASAADLASSLLVRQQIKDYPEEKTQAAKQEFKRKLAERPPAPMPKFEEDQAVADKASAGSEAADTQAFRPPLRGAAAKEAEFAEAKKKAEEQRKAAADAAKAEKERKAQRQKEAREEMRQMMATDLGEAGYNPADAPRPLTARVEVNGAGDSRLDGIYQVQFATKDRIEFTKVNDEQCQIFWSSYQDEWRMMIGDYKMGSTLYRNNYRPNWKADVCHGCPVEKWQKWFGKDGVPTIRLIPEPTEGDPAESRVETVGDESGEDVEGTTAETPTSPSGADAAAAPTQAAEQQSTKKAEFLELHSKLNIVSVDNGAERRGATASNLNTQSREIRLTEGGERIVETADGLFAAGEIQVEDTQMPAVEEQDSDSLARAWLTSTGTSKELPLNWESILAAKGTSMELYKEQKIEEACQATTVAILALEKFAALEHQSVTNELGDSAPPPGQRRSEAEIEDMRGVLHSNRSLLLQHQITAGDKAVLAFGADAAWRLVVNDSDIALRANPTNFKASFRRARALLELGELEEALQDATNVVDHYASTNSTPNPEAAALRERILSAIKQERSKWGEKAPRRWNHSAKLIMEVSSSSMSKKDEEATKEKGSKSVSAGMPWDSKAATAPSTLPQRLPDSSGKQLPPPKTSSDVEKALLSTLKKDPKRQLAYVQEHLPVATLRRFYKRTPLGPDMLSRLILICADLVEEDTRHAEDLVCALAAVPSAKTDVAMFDDSEQGVLQRLTSRLGSKATDAWAD